MSNSDRKHIAIVSLRLAAPLGLAVALMLIVVSVIAAPRIVADSGPAPRPAPLLTGTDLSDSQSGGLGNQGALTLANVTMNSWLSTRSTPEAASPVEADARMSAPDLVIVKSATPTNAIPGETITYTSNAGPSGGTIALGGAQLEITKSLTIEAGVLQDQEGQATAQIEIEPQLLAQLAADETSGYLIYLGERPDLSPAFEMDWKERGRFVYDTLRKTAKRSQAKVSAYLDAQKALYQIFWIDNVIYVESSKRATFDGLLSFTEISALRADQEMRIPEPEQRGPVSSRATQYIEPNLIQINADDAWAMGYRGDGIVVASIDGGVEWRHDALTDQYRGQFSGYGRHDFNWLDPTSGNTTPYDGDGHGTHVTGIMVGDNRSNVKIGVATNAQWIACRACQDSTCYSSKLLACAQWITAPYPIGETAGADPNKRPHIVNNSWGGYAGRPYNNWFQGTIDAWHAAGIYPVFSNGNNGDFGCNAVGNPGRYGNVTGVGATSRTGGILASFSSWGPTDNADTVNPHGYPFLKPQVVAPGVSIFSSSRYCANCYINYSGTSMAAPHVSGLIALMWQANPGLIGDYASTETLIELSANPIPYVSNCGVEGPGNVPNSATGWGEIDALAAVQAALYYVGPGTLAGTVTDADTGSPIEGATVEAAAGLPQLYEQAETNAAGAYSLDLINETYHITASAYSYYDQVINNIVVAAGQTVNQSINLTPLPRSLSPARSSTVSSVNPCWRKSPLATVTLTIQVIPFGPIQPPAITVSPSIRAMTTPSMDWRPTTFSKTSPSAL